MQNTGEAQEKTGCFGEDIDCDELVVRKCLVNTCIYDVQNVISSSLLFFPRRLIPQVAGNLLETHTCSLMACWDFSYALKRYVHAVKQRIEVNKLETWILDHRPIKYRGYVNVFGIQHFHEPVMCQGAMTYCLCMYPPTYHNLCIVRKLLFFGF